MKHFAFQITEQGMRRGKTCTEKCIVVWQIKRNRMVKVATRHYHCESDFQAFMNTAEQKKLMPLKAFERHPMGRHQHAYSEHLEAAGFATVDQI